ncbi:hypothetical protein KO507_07940 [Gilvimarinus agarilyticus]|uniref:hypothetical protein n=1 Tax=Gilvimarinus sp. 2_MG-2023 TaxID=3062666 RepID=UPI001C09F3DA|nr:hypothetical protein [Gilvimarinus sp. 2_MG-2023]MBU2885689.1 hypothetical protein [Gilvimarinus agarilyticus]MDO6570549.1 hypothetical protein [Gilvimarinus sp. 2_MG-2023]
MDVDLNHKAHGYITPTQGFRDGAAYCALPIELDAKRSSPYRLPLLISAAIASLILHSLLLFLTPAKPVPQDQPTAIQVTLHKKADTAIPTRQTAAAVQSAKKAPQPAHTNTAPVAPTKPAAAPLPGTLPHTGQAKAKPSASRPTVTRQADITQSGTSTPATEAGNIFHPGLRQQLKRARSHSAQPSASTEHYYSFRDPSGATRVNMKGRCFRQSLSHNTRGTDWYITGCLDDNSEGASILSGLKQQLQR